MIKNSELMKIAGLANEAGFQEAGHTSKEGGLCRQSDSDVEEEG